LQRALDQLLSMIDVATTRIATEYFQLPVAGADAVYRERVYCYELYHQLRSIWDQFPFSIGGEIDKSGNPHFRGGPYAGAEPDLLVHVPGNMEANLAVVEIKSANAGLGGIREDLRKLNWFCANARYFRGIFLVYGDAGEPDRLAAMIRRAVAADIDVDPITCIYHRRVGERIELIPP
jgi:hypothetical protein